MEKNVCQMDRRKRSRRLQLIDGFNAIRDNEFERGKCSLNFTIYGNWGACLSFTCWSKLDNS